MTLDQILIFLPVAFVIGASPGANNLVAFASATTAGWRLAGQAVAGRIAAWAVLVVLVSFGLDTLLRTSELAFVTLRWMGVAYLLYLAWTVWWADLSAQPPAPDAPALMRREFLTLLGNPKAYLLLTAFLPQFVTGAGPVMPQLLVLGGVYAAVEALAAMLWVGAGSLVGGHALTPIRRAILNRASAGLLVIAALALARSDKAA